METINRNNTQVFDARGISAGVRHTAFFGVMDRLEAGTVMRFINDQDPQSLLAQIAQRYGDRVRPEQIEGVGRVVIDFHIGSDRRAA
ncbi:DUF2249 domain-containing protein [Uliginosibacterium paludis]|jgi:uncharacterized protein (DUF2249 family)|uniref:DUF2249 domain-containing protein n=1 Tax=Uliginosibacterium paludis TaxID=1615952 RepID=A0ABV2CP54_9RHOO